MMTPTTSVPAIVPNGLRRAVASSSDANVLACCFADVARSEPVSATPLSRFVPGLKLIYCLTYSGERRNTISELEAPMNQVQIEQKSYEMPPRQGISIAHFLTVADFERSA